MTRQVLSWSFDAPSLTTNHGAAFIAIAIEAMMPPEKFHERVTHVIREIRETPRATGCDRVLVPGEMEWERRTQALAEGINFPADVIASLRGLSDDLEIERALFPR